MKLLAPGVFLFQSALWQTNSAVLETPDLVLVSDPTWLPGEVQAIAEYVRAIRGTRPLFLLLTHSDYDHILGWGAFPEATTIASRAFVDNPAPEKAVHAARAWDDGYYVVRPYEICYPKVDIAASDGQVLTVGGTTLTFYTAPGHTPDGLLTVIEPSGVLIAGDYLSDLEFPFLEDSRAYAETLAKIEPILTRHRVHTLVPGHGSAAASADEILTRRQRDLDYLAALHRFVTEGNQAALDAMPSAYPFPLGLHAFHEANQGRVREELLHLPQTHA